MQDWIKTLALSTVAVLAPIHTVMIAVGLLIGMDLITGIMAAKKQGDKITSAAMRRTISKMAVYQMVVVSGFLVETYLIDGIIPVVKLIGGVIGVVEITSILENANKILGENVFKKVIASLGSDNDNKKEDNK